MHPSATVATSATDRSFRQTTAHHRTPPHRKPWHGHYLFYAAQRRKTRQAPGITTTTDLASKPSVCLPHSSSSSSSNNVRTDEGTVISWHLLRVIPGLGGFGVHQQVHLHKAGTEGRGGGQNLGLGASKIPNTLSSSNTNNKRSPPPENLKASSQALTRKNTQPAGFELKSEPTSKHRRD